MSDDRDYDEEAANRQHMIDEHDTDPRCNCNWRAGTYSTLSDPTPRYKAHADNCPANAPTLEPPSA